MGRDMMRLRRGILLNTPHVETASGAVASFKTDVSKLKECVVNIEPVQEGSGDPSPDNVRPISGWSEAKVYDDPKYARTIWWNQLADSEARSGDHFAEEWASTIFGSNGTLVVTTTRDYTQFGFDFVDRSVLIQNGHKYFVSAELKTCSFVPDRVQFVLATRWNQMGSLIMSYDGLGTYAGFITATGDGVAGDPQRLLLRLTGTSVIGDNATYYGCTWIDLTAMFGAGNEPTTVEAFKAMFPHNYYAYNAGEETLVSAVNGEPYRAVTISLDGTRYGGTVDVLTGEMRVTHGIYTFTGKEGFAIADSPSHVPPPAFQYFRWYASSFTRVISNWKLTQDAIMSCYSVDNGLAYWYSGGVGKTVNAWTVANYAGICVRNDNYTSAAELKTALVGQSLVYALASPFTVQLSPTQLRALKGQNNIFADCGDVAVDFWKHGG